MNAHPDRPELLSNAACILANLSFADANLVPMVALGADKALLQCLENVKGALHTEGEFCVRALANLSSDAAIRKQLIDAGALKIVEAVADFVPDADLALANLKLV